MSASTRPRRPEPKIEEVVVVAADGARLDAFAGAFQRLQRRRLLRQKPALHLARNLHFLLGCDARPPCVWAIFSASVMLRMAMPAWLATDASKRLSMAEYGLFREPRSEHEPALAIAHRWNRGSAPDIPAPAAASWVPCISSGISSSGPLRSASIGNIPARRWRASSLPPAGCRRRRRNCPVAVVQVNKHRLRMQSVPDVLLQ